MIATVPVEFVRAHTLLAPVPHVPEVRLYLASEVIALWERTETAAARTGLAPPFWAFPWAGGQALARYVFDNPGVVAGRRVLDVAAGSGLVAIAAALAGASAVTATEIDIMAVAAIGLNAQANGVTVQINLGDVCDVALCSEVARCGGEACDGDLCGGKPAFDVVLAGDVFYSRPMAERVLAFLDRARVHGARVIVGDPGRAYLPRGRLHALARQDVPVNRSLEDADTKSTTVWQLREPPVA